MYELKAIIHVNSYPFVAESINYFWAPFSLFNLEKNIKFILCFQGIFQLMSVCNTFQVKMLHSKEEFSIFLL